MQTFTKTIFFTVITLFFAVKLTKAELPEFFDYILVAYVVVYVISHLILLVSLRHSLYAYFAINVILFVGDELHCR